MRLLNAAGDAIHHVGVANAEQLIVSWSGFTESCSGVQKYEVALEAGAERLWTSGLLEAATSRFALPENLTSLLANGQMAEISVTATSHAGASSTAQSGFTVDRTLPVVGTVFNAGGTDVLCQSLSQPFSISWDNIDDAQSGISSIQWSLGTSPEAADLMGPVPVHGNNGSVRRTWLAPAAAVEPTGVVFSSLRVRNGAGDELVVSATPVRAATSGCASSYVCLPPASGAAGVPHWMLPLVLGLAYDVRGNFSSSRGGEEELAVVAAVAATSAVGRLLRRDGRGCYESSGTRMMDGDFNLQNGFTLGDAISVAQIWSGAGTFPWQPPLEDPVTG